MLNFLINHQEVVLWPVVVILIVHVFWLVARETRRTRYRLVKAKPRKLILFCYDPRFYEAFTRFISNKKKSWFFWVLWKLGFGKRNGLGLKSGQYVIRKEAGGVAPMAYETVMPKRFTYVKRHFVFTASHFKFVEEVIIFGHEECAYYGVIPQDGRTDRIREDLVTIAKEMKKTLEEMSKGHIKVSAYYARIVGRRRNRIEFEKIDLSQAI